MNRLFNTKNFYLIVALLSIFTLISAVYIEYVLGAKACKLCLYQRYLWLFLLLVCILNIKKSNKSKYFEIIITITLCAIITLSFYHSGIEFGFFNNIISCISENNETANSIEELDFLIRNTKNMDCAFPKFKIFNLSLSNLSFLFSTSLLLLCLKKYNRNIFK